MAAKKASTTAKDASRSAKGGNDPAPATQVIGPVSSERVDHALAHVARITRMLEQRPDHPGRAQLEELLANYREWMSQVDPEALIYARKRVEQIHDMTPDAVTRAVRHLEG